MEYRYLIYPVDNGQSSPTLTNRLPWWMAEKYDETEPCYDVVVDLQEQRRWFQGEWAAVDTDESIRARAEGNQ